MCEWVRALTQTVHLEWGSVWLAQCMWLVHYVTTHSHVFHLTKLFTKYSTHTNRYTSGNNTMSSFMARQKWQRIEWAYKLKHTLFNNKTNTQIELTTEMNIVPEIFKLRASFISISLSCLFLHCVYTSKRMNYEPKKENKTKHFRNLTFVDATNSFYNRYGSDVFHFIDTASLDRDRGCLLVVVLGDGNDVVASLLCRIQVVSIMFSWVLNSDASQALSKYYYLIQKTMMMMMMMKQTSRTYRWNCE